MARRTSTATQVSVRLGHDAVDDQGIALQHDIVVSPNDDSVIAPWIDEPPKPAVKPTSSRFGFPAKSSFSTTISNMRQGSSSSSVLRHPRKSDSLNMSIEDLNKRHSADDDRPFNLRERIDSSSSSFISSTISTNNTSHTSHSVNHQIRKAKSSMFSRLRSRSRTALRADALEAEHPSLRAPPPPIPDRDASFFPLAPQTATGSSPFLLKKSDKKKKSSSGGTQPSSPVNDTSSKPNEDSVFTLDTNIDHMEGIINLDSLQSSSAASTSTASPPSSFPPQTYSYQEHSPPSLNLDFSSPSSGVESSSRISISLSDHSSSFYHTYYSPITSADFSNPFLPGPASAAAKRKGIQPRVKDKDRDGNGERERDKQSISPTQVLSDRPLPSIPVGIGSRWPDKTDWMPPESWAVEKDDGEELAGESSSSEDSVSGAPGVGLGLSLGTGTKRLSTVSPHANPVLHGNTMSAGTATNGFATHFNPHSIPNTPPPPYPVSIPNPYTSSSPHVSPHFSPHTSPHAPRRKRTHPSNPNSKHRGSIQTNAKPMQIRIYRANNAFHIATIAPHVSVASLTPALNERLLQGKDVEMHRLYLKERGRERILGQTERPADIVRRRVEQAGYDQSDAADLLNSDLSFILKFVYKSQLLGPTDEELVFENFEHVDLAGRSLRTIPVVLHQHADSIISLKLSRNPMLEIPLDFIQSCTTLRELRLSNMAMKKVPTSVRQATTLHRLDLSSNRIGDLEEAYLDNLIYLTALHVQNNKIEKLPWHFPRLRSLVTLNVSNNKFRVFPPAITHLEALRDLDVSFNMIAELPEEPGGLVGLERLVLVGNQIVKFPNELATGLKSLRVLDCRRNLISGLHVISMLPALHTLSADHNAVQSLTLAVGPCLATLDASHNEITQLELGGVGLGSRELGAPYALTSLDISHAKLSSLDGLALGTLASLRILRIGHNTFRSIPDTLGELTELEILSCADNKLDALPSSIGKLGRLEELDAHNNCLTELPVGIWECGSLRTVNVTSNFLGVWGDPPVVGEGAGWGWGFQSASTFSLGEFSVMGGSSGVPTGRKGSAASLGGSSISTLDAVRMLPPLVNSLEKLYLGENRLTDDVLRTLMIFKELRILNLSFNDLQDLPTNFLRNLTSLEELYLSGNKLTSIPTEDLHRMGRLSVLYLNGNRLQTLPQELGKVKSLTVLDVGSNLLKYNVNNWEFDWNWNFNKNLKYLNLSGNNRLQIKTDPEKRLVGRRHSGVVLRQSLSGFTDLTRLRVLGLMDVTITTTGICDTVDIPDESDDRRVRTSLSTVNGMAYGIADTLGKNDYMSMLDLVQQWPKGEAIFAMFGRTKPPRALPPGATPNRLAKFLRERFVDAFRAQLGALKKQQGDGVLDALRRTFLKLNQDLHDSLFTSNRKGSRASSSGGGSGGGGGGGGMGAPDPATLRSGVSGIVLYFVGKTLYVANVGRTLAVVSRQGVAHAVSTSHDPFDRSETARIRAAEGWVSPAGLVNEEAHNSRAFGYYHLLPVINARPDLVKYELTPQDEFVIVANRGLWDYVSYQTAVDIARTERGDPMIAAQKLRDFSISYGADGSTMIMVIGIAETLEVGVPKRKPQILDRDIDRLTGEVPPPVGHIALVFSDIRNSTPLWEANPGMPTAHRLHNTVLRRQLRFCGGYEVKTEGDAFMCSFPTALAAVWWSVAVQLQLLHEPWPLEILECEDGKPLYDSEGRLVARGLSVRMGIHCGWPSPEPDPITHRMDYFGSMVNRSARITGHAAGGQIMCSADIIREINATIFETESETEYSRSQPQQAIEAIRQANVKVFPVGEVKLKGLEIPEYLSLLYPEYLVGRQNLERGPSGMSASGSRVPFNVAQIRELGVICLRLESLTTDRNFRQLPQRKASIQTVSMENDAAQLSNPRELFGDPNVLLPPMNDQCTDLDLRWLLDSLATRIENAAIALCRIYDPSYTPSISKRQLMSALTQDGKLDDRTLEHILSLLESI